MELILHRKYLKNDYTIGKLYLKDSSGNQVYLCDTLEDKVRDLNKNGKFDNGEAKVQNRTAIPYGVYKIAMDAVSPKYSNANKYPKYAKYGGKLPRLCNVPNFTGVLIHCGNHGDYTKVVYSFDIDKKKDLLPNGTKIKVI